jgi:hypothetical protein
VRSEAVPARVRAALLVGSAAACGEATPRTEIAIEVPSASGDARVSPSTSAVADTCDGQTLRRAPVLNRLSAVHRSAFSIIAAVAAVGCSTTGGSTSVATSSAQAVGSAFDRRHAPSPDMADVPRLEAIDANARDKMISRIPTSSPTGDTLVGTETGVDLPDGGTDTYPPKKKRTDKHVLRLDIVERPSASTEKMLRSSVYYPLVQHCRGPDGAILPGESIELKFLIDGNGHIEPTSVKASAKDPRFQAASECMVRELIAAPFRAPTVAHGATTNVTALVPPID